MKTAVKDVMTTRVIWVSKNAAFQEMAAALRGPSRPDQALCAGRSSAIFD
jgi:hypothetical protein